MKKNGAIFFATAIVLAVFYIMIGAFAAWSIKAPNSAMTSRETRRVSGESSYSFEESNVVVDLEFGEGSGKNVGKIYAYVGEVRSSREDDEGREYVNLVFDFKTRSSSQSESYSKRVGNKAEDRIYLNRSTGGYRWILVYDFGSSPVSYPRATFHTDDCMDVYELAFVDSDDKLVSAKVASSDNLLSGGGESLFDEQSSFTAKTSAAYRFSDKEIDEINAVKALASGEGEFKGVGALNSLLNAAAIAAFGLNTFSMRFFSALSGYILLLLVYRLTEILFGKSEISLFATLSALFMGTIFTSSFVASALVSSTLTVAAYLFAVKFFVSDYKMADKKRGGADIVASGLFYGLAIAANASAITTVLGLIAIYLFAFARAKRLFKEREKEASGIDKYNVFVEYSSGIKTAAAALVASFVALPVLFTTLSYACFASALTSGGKTFFAAVSEIIGRAFLFEYSLNPFGLLLGIGSDNLGGGRYAFSNIIPVLVATVSTIALIVAFVFQKKNDKLSGVVSTIKNRAKLTFAALVGTLLPVFFGASSVLQYGAASAIFAVASALALFAALKAFGKKARVGGIIVLAVGAATFVLGFAGFVGLDVPLWLANISYGWRI